MLEHPQTLARNMVLETDHPVAGRVRSLGSAVKMSRGAASSRAAAVLGQHTREVLQEMGMEDAEVEALIARDVLLSPDPRTGR